MLGEEARVVGFDGHTRDVETNAGAVVWEGEWAVQVEMRDITARVAADAALRASEDRFRVLFHTAPVGIVESLPDGTMLAVKPARTCALLGHAAHELVGRPISMVTDSSEREAMGVAVADLVRPDGPVSYSVQRTYRRKDGTPLEVVVSVASIRDADGRVQRVVGSLLDVLDRAAVEERLRETAGRLGERQAFTDALLDNVEVGIVAWDAAGRLTTVNGAARLWRGVDVDAELDRPSSPGTTTSTRPTAPPPCRSSRSPCSWRCAPAASSTPRS